MTIKRYVVGERVKRWPANSWNEMADRVEGPELPALEPDGDDPGGIIPVRNSSTTDIPKGGIMQPTGSMLTLTGQADHVANAGPLVLVDVPDLSDGAEATYMVATQPIPAGLTGGGILMGPVWARVDIRDTDDKYAQVIDDDVTKLESTASGSRARIIAQEEGTGEVWALILLAPYRLRIRKGIVNNTAGQTEIEAGGSGTVDVYQNGVNTGEENTWNLDWLYGDLPATKDISTDIRCIAADFEDENIFTVIASDCEAEPAAAPPGHGDSITAETSQAQGDGILSYRINRVTIVGSDNDSVTLPDDFSQGDDCVIQNSDDTGSNTLQIYPASGHFINDASVNVSETLASGSTVHYFLVQGGKWVS